MKKFLEIYSFESEIERKLRLVLRFLFTELCAVAFEDDGDSLRQWLDQLLARDGNIYDDSSVR